MQYPVRVPKRNLNFLSFEWSPIKSLYRDLCLVICLPSVHIYTYDPGNFLFNLLQIQSSKCSESVPLESATTNHERCLFDVAIIEKNNFVLPTLIFWTLLAYGKS